MNRKIKLLIIVIICICVVGIFFRQESIKEQIAYEYCDAYVMRSELPALLGNFYFSKEEWKDILEEEQLDELVTGKTAIWIVERMGASEYIKLTYDDESIPLSREEWTIVYEQLLDLLDNSNQVKVMDEVILDVENNGIKTDTGSYETDMNAKIFHEMSAISFYVRENSIIGIKSMKAKEAVLSNVYITEARMSGLSFLLDKTHYSIDLDLDNPTEVENRVCDLNWKDGVIAKVQLKEDTIQGDLLAVNDAMIEIEGYGQINRSENLPVYKTYGTVEEKELEDIVIANMKVNYVVAGNQVEAILLVEPAKIGRIRVVLLEDTGSPYRENVYIQANTEMKLVYEGKKILASEETVVSAETLFAQTEQNHIKIKTTDEGELYFCDEAGNIKSLGYQGTFELYRYPEGYVVVNQLPLENYLCAVVPSEMPATYEMEALKAQAICARSYAYIQLNRGDYAALGAHVDDSTNYQVYNKQQRHEKTTAAVWDTAGKIVSFMDEPAETYYYSTSAGVTSDGDCWNLEEDTSYDYLHSVHVAKESIQKDLSKESAFEAFLTSDTDTYYESNLPFYRWEAEVDFSEEEVRKSVLAIIKNRKEKKPEDILYINAKGEEVNNTNGFGKYKGVSVTKRSTSGEILQLTLAYKKGKILIGNEYTIRMVLGAGLNTLRLSDGSEKNDFGLLPSAFCIIKEQRKGVYTIIGGGYGHGIGMSQNGAGEMAKDGWTCEEILQFFFKNIEILEVQ